MDRKNTGRDFYPLFCPSFAVAFRGIHPFYSLDKATPDIATAIVWMGKHAAGYHVDMSKLIIAGASAGGGLALQVA
jgi:acetyl esterase/lipase